MFSVLLIKGDDGDAYQIVETCTGEAPVVFSGSTLETCLTWLHTNGGSTWQSQKWNIVYLLNTLGLDAVWTFQAALEQQTSLTAYEKLVNQGASLESFDYTQRFLKGWPYGVLEWLQWEFEQELGQAHYFREVLSETRGKGFLPRQRQKRHQPKERQQRLKSSP